MILHLNVRGTREIRAGAWRDEPNLLEIRRTINDNTRAYRRVRGHVRFRDRVVQFARVCVCFSPRK